MRKADKITSFRIILLVIGSAVVFTGLIMRLYYVQMVKAPSLVNQSIPGRTWRRPLPATRGMILDCNQRTLAVSTSSSGSYVVMIDKVHVENVTQSVRQAGSILDLSNTSMKRHTAALLQPEIKARVLEDDVSSSLKKRLLRADIPGLVIKDQPGRYYPEGSLASHLIGFTGKAQKGLAGLEYALDERLEVDERVILAEKDKSLRPLASEDLTKIMNQRLDVILTIDSYIQYVVERELKKVCEECDALNANAVVLHAPSGEVLSFANYPKFDPNHYQDYSEKRRRNQLLTDMYEPGSIIKPFTVIAALDKGVVKPDTVFDCENGSYWIWGKTIRDDIHKFGKLTVKDILIRSSNIGVVKITQCLGSSPEDYKKQAAILYDYLRRFGFKHIGDPSTTLLPGENVGILRPPSQWQPSSIRSIPYGQEMMTNSLILARAYSVIANRGLFISPSVIKGFRSGDGVYVPREPAEPFRVFSRAVIEPVVQMMVGVTEDPEGTGRRVRIPGFHVAGKTGTAQKAVNGSYAKGKRVATFAGFFPAEDPQIVIVVKVDEPKKKKYGGEVAGPVWKKIAEEIIAYWGLSPTYKTDPLFAKATEEKSVSGRQITKNSTETPPRTFGVSGIMPVPSEGENDNPAGTMPNLVGLTIRESYVELIRRGFQGRFIGNGKVVEQEIEAGTELKGETNIGRIYCKPVLTDPGISEEFPMIAKH